MDKTYQPAALEQKWYQAWEQAGYFRPSGTGDPFSIMIPPPNVTGSLHMGHAFQHTLMDTLVRYQRMRGRNTLWQVGTDHAGIATQMVVERRLAAQGRNRHDLGREDFIDEVWRWKAESGGAITRQMRRLGNSVDWDSERFTMDEGFYQAVQEVFVRLHEDGLIYRGKRLVNWDPALHTAISDLEVENSDEQGSLWHFRYPLADGSGDLVVATTRPETMLGDTAVAVHPEDERYRHLVGRQVRLPVTGRLIPVVADDYVDPEFGTGCVKITPAHDFNDYEVGQRQQLPLINIFDRNAVLLEAFQCLHADGSDNGGEPAPAGYAGLDRLEARRRIVAEAERDGWLEAVEAHALKVPRGDRSGVIIEPWLTDQWYVRVAPLAEQAIAAVEDGRIRFVPQSYENMYFAWMRNLQDWCISRQLWWGHRIPAWYDAEGRVYVGRNEDEVRHRHALGDTPLTRDPDVLDTWFSSALWTFATLGWPQESERLRTFHPTEVLVTGFDIIFFWVARMIMMTMHFMKNPEDGSPQVPFRTVYVTGLIRDEQGQKMSKSKGNVLDPLDMIDGISRADLVAKRTGNLMQPQQAEKIRKRTEKQFPEGIAAHGTDALRYTLAALASTGRDINWDMKRLEGYRNFCNKLWNAARYVLMNTEQRDCASDNQDRDYSLSLADRWIISRLQRTEEDVARHFAQYRFDLIAQSLYEFVWNEYCDWYLELSKPILYAADADPRAQKGTRRTLLRVLEATLRLLHPLMPFITEEIWQRVAPLAGAGGDTIMLAPYPRAEQEKLDAEAEADVDWLRAVIVGIRNIRGEMNIPPGREVPVLLKGSNTEEQRRLRDNRHYLMTLARLSELRWLEAGEEPPLAATQLAGDSEVLVPMAGLIDRDAELARLDRELGKLHKEIERLRSKLDNPAFTDKAPAEVVAKEREKCSQNEAAVARLQQQRSRIADL